MLGIRIRVKIALTNIPPMMTVARHGRFASRGRDDHERHHSENACQRAHVDRARPDTDGFSDGGSNDTDARRACPLRVCRTSRIALLTTRPSNIRKPIVVRRSMACAVNRFKQCVMTVPPPAIASGIDSMTMQSISTADRNIAAMMSNSTTAAMSEIAAHGLERIRPADLRYR